MTVVIGEEGDGLPSHGEGGLHGSSSRHKVFLRLVATACDYSPLWSFFSLVVIAARGGQSIQSRIAVGTLEARMNWVYIHLTNQRIMMIVSDAWHSCYICGALLHRRDPRSSKYGLFSVFCHLSKPKRWLVYYTVSTSIHK